MTRLILSFILCAVATAAPSQATPSIGERCDAGDREACEKIAKIHGGQCASPRRLGGCRFDSLSY